MNCGPGTETYIQVSVQGGAPDVDCSSAVPTRESGDLPLDKPSLSPAPSKPKNKSMEGNRGNTSVCISKVLFYFGYVAFEKTAVAFRC